MGTCCAKPNSKKNVFSNDQPALPVHKTRSYQANQSGKQFESSEHTFSQPRQLQQVNAKTLTDSTQEKQLGNHKHNLEQQTLPSQNDGQETTYQSSAASSNMSVKTQNHFDWQKGELLGRGAYGQVYQGLNMESGELIAIKSVKFSGDKNRIVKEIENLKLEISLLKTLDHPNIVKYLQTDVCTDKSGVDIILEYMPGGSLRSLLDKFGKFDEKLVKIYLRQILSGLSYLHSNGVIHRDIKCANILVSGEGQIKLSDFGASKRLSYANTDPCQDQEMCNSIKGSPYWIAPEIVQQKGYSFAADIWSLGCLLIEMLTGRPPWVQYGSVPSQILKIIRDTKTPPFMPDDISKEARSFLEVCLRVDPSLRPTSQMLFDHPFVKGDLLNQNREAIKQKITIKLDQILDAQNNRNPNLQNMVSYAEVTESSQSMMSSSVADNSVVSSKYYMSNKNQVIDKELRKIEQRKRIEQKLMKALAKQNNSQQSFKHEFAQNRI